MTNLVNLTQARNNLSQLVNQVFSEKKSYILIRGSIPQAVIIPYQKYEKEEQKWQDEIRELMKSGRKRFSEYLAENNIKPPKNENEVYKIIDTVSGRS